MAENPKRPPRPLPPSKFEDVLRLAQVIADQGTGKPMDRLLLADAYGIKPGSSNYRELLRSGSQYGLTKGSEKVELISLGDLGVRATKPTFNGEREQAICEAIQRPELARKIYAHFNRAKWPDQAFLKNLLQRQFGVGPEWSAETATVLEENARMAGVFRTISGSVMLMLESPNAPLTPAPEGEPIEASAENGGDAEVATLVGPRNRESPIAASNGGSGGTMGRGKTSIFIGHGKNAGPLKQLREMLDQFKIPYKIAVYEPNRGLPISQKVRSVMDECSSAILLFTKDECLYTKEGGEVWRPSENAVHELGAASALYGGRIIVFKENGLELPTNFRDIGYIGFDADQIKAKAVELLQELIAFGLVAITPAQ